MRYARKVDANQRQIAQALSRSGHHVTDLSAVGGGVPDLLCTRNGQCFLVEIKNQQGRNRFTPSQLEYYDLVKAPVYILRSINDVESLIKGRLSPINGSQKEPHASPAHPR